jgi:hypothetical protein
MIIWDDVLTFSLQTASLLSINQTDTALEAEPKRVMGHKNSVPFSDNWHFDSCYVENIICSHFPGLFAQLL